MGRLKKKEKQFQWQGMANEVAWLQRMTLKKKAECLLMTGQKKSMSQWLKS